MYLCEGKVEVCVRVLGIDLSVLASTQLTLSSHPRVFKHLFSDTLSAAS